MLPGPLVLVMLFGMDLLRRAEIAKSVSTAAGAAFAVGASAGAAAGTAAGIGIIKPGIVPMVIKAPLKIINAPFYYLLGGHLRLCKLVLNLMERINSLHNRMEVCKLWRL